MDEANQRTRRRIPNKTLAALRKILETTMSGRRFYREALDRNEQKYMDPILATALARIGEALADIERIARSARDGGGGDEGGD